jgi:NAD-dependent deacetylase
MSDRDGTNLQAGIREARAWVAEAERVVVLTGAGISTESGIPDFRGKDGLWTKNPEAMKLSTIQHYLADTEVRKQSWQGRLAPGNWRAEPNAGHAALVELERRGQLHTLVTQNVDGLHQKAGTHHDRVVEIHGTMQEFVCMDCGDRGPIDGVLDRVRNGEEDPCCHGCSGILKTATISFGQSLVAEDLDRAFKAATQCDLLLAVGTTLSVYPIADMVPRARAQGARIVILNGDPTDLDDHAGVVLRGQIGDVLPQVVAARAH